MSKLPTDQRVAALTSELARFDARAAGRRLRHALAVERHNSDTPDGWPEGHANGDGGNGGGPKVLVTNEEGDPESVAVTAVELAVIRRERSSSDPYRAAVRTACRSQETAAKALDAMLSALDAIDTITKLAADDAGLTPEPGCWAMARVESWEAIFRTTEIAGRKYALGRWAYDFAARAGRLPTKDECERHKNGLTVRLPAAVVTRWSQRV